MYKIYLVEDESSVRNAIREKIEWEEAGFLYTGEAPDGEVAFREICELAPDIVITDIKMPFMTGLELAAKLKSVFPRIRVVILTGHDDFDYAQQAIQYGVSDYLLKPLSASRMNETLKRIAVQMDDERKIFNELNELRRQEIRSASIREQQFVRELCLNRITNKKTILSESVPEGIALTEKPTSVILLEFRNEIGEIERIRNYLQWMSSDASDYYFLSFSHVRFGIVIRCEDKAELEDKLFLLSQTIKDYINAHFSTEIVIAIGTTVRSWLELFYAYADADGLLNSYYGSNKIIFKGNDNDNRREQIIEKVKKIIDENFSDPELSLSSVAVQVSVSSGRLSTMFHDVTGEKFISFLNRIRLEKSAVLLKTTDRQISDISEICGYNQAHYYSYLFKREYGLSPHNYRQER